jgi:hypothetical protein
MLHTVIDIDCTERTIRNAVNSEVGECIAHIHDSATDPACIKPRAISGGFSNLRSTTFEHGVVAECGQRGGAAMGGELCPTETQSVQSFHCSTLSTSFSA